MLIRENTRYAEASPSKEGRVGWIEPGTRCSVRDKAAKHTIAGSWPTHMSPTT